MKYFVLSLSLCLSCMLSSCIGKSFSPSGETFFVQMENAENPQQCEKTLHILQTRTDNAFGGKGKWVKAVEGEAGVFEVSIPKNFDRKRLEFLVTNCGKLEFYRTFDANEIYPIFERIDSLCAQRYSSPIADEADEQPFEEVHPLFVLFTPKNKIDSMTTPYSSLGRTSEKDLPALQKILNHPEIKLLFPPGLLFLWKTVEEKGTEKETYELHTLRTEPGGKSAMDGRYIESAKADMDHFGEALVTFHMNHEGAEKWAKLTRENIDKDIAIVLNGRLLCAPKVNCEIVGGGCQIVGGFSFEEAIDIANILQSGNLDTPLKIVQK